MKKPAIEQLINNGLIEGTDFTNPLDFSNDSWGKYDETKQDWVDPKTGELVKVATFGQVRKWILNSIQNLKAEDLIIKLQIASFGENIPEVITDAEMDEVLYNNN